MWSTSNTAARLGGYQSHEEELYEDLHKIPINLHQERAISRIAFEPIVTNNSLPPGEQLVVAANIRTADGGQRTYVFNNEAGVQIHSQYKYMNFYLFLLEQDVTLARKLAVDLRHRNLLPLTRTQHQHLSMMVALQQRKITQWLAHHGQEEYNKLMTISGDSFYKQMTEMITDFRISDPQ